jgi:hypothetical protein
MNLIARFFGALLRVALLIFGALLLLATLFAAFVLGSLALLWALVRGRRPALRASFGPRFEQARRQAQARSRAPAGEVIDIEVREVR